MSLKGRIDADLKQALKAGDKLRLSCLRMLKSKIQEKELALRAERGKAAELTDDEVVEVVASYAKQRRDSIEAYEKGSRAELAQRERDELAIVSEFMPRQLSRDAITPVVREAIGEIGARSIKDLGAVMKLVMPRLKGAADGKLVSEIVREQLSQ